MMTKLIHYILVLFLLGVITVHKGYTQTCTTIVNLQINRVTTVDGLQITTTAERVYLYSLTYSTPCLEYTVPANSLHIGKDHNQGFSLKLEFSKQIESIVLILTATDVTESFNFTSNGGTVRISAINSCFLDIVGNNIRGSSNLPSGQIKTGTGILEISAAQPFTELTISGTGAGNGSILALCRTGIKVCNAFSNPNKTAATEYTEAGVSDLHGFSTVWPKNIPNGFIAIESRNQGFVITRVKSVNDIPMENLVEGMLVYDITDACVKLYNGTKWHCIELDC